MILTDCLTQENIILDILGKFALVRSTARSRVQMWTLNSGFPLFPHPTPKPLAARLPCLLPASHGGKKVMTLSINACGKLGKHPGDQAQTRGQTLTGTQGWLVTKDNMPDLMGGGASLASMGGFSSVSDIGSKIEQILKISGLFTILSRLSAWETPSLALNQISKNYLEEALVR